MENPMKTYPARKRSTLSFPIIVVVAAMAGILCYLTASQSTRATAGGAVYLPAEPAAGRING
jgi:hypothetical protein